MRIGRRALIAVAVTNVVAVTCYAGAVTERALVVFVGPAAVLGSLVAAALFAQRRPRSALGVGLLVALGWAELVNVVSGMGYGPAARSSFVVGGCAVLAVALAASPAPAAFLVPVAGSVLGALILGAGAEVRAEALATGVVAMVALAVVEAERRQWKRRAGRAWSVLLLPLLATAIAALVVVTQAHHDSRTPNPGATASVNSRITPPFGDPFPAVGSRAAHAAAVARHHHRPAHHHHARGHHRHLTQPQPPRTRAVHQQPAQRHHIPIWVWILAGLGGLLLLLALLFLARLIIARWSWRRLRRRLRNRDPAAAAIGAWTWARLRLAAYRMALPARMSPEVAARGEGLDDAPAAVVDSLRALGRAVTPVAFEDRPASWHAVDEAWKQADAAAREGRMALSRAGRLRVAITAAPKNALETRSWVPAGAPTT